MNSDWPLSTRIKTRLSRWRRSNVERRFGILFEEFCKWFRPETADDEMKYDAIAAEPWLLWSSRQLNSGSKLAS
jgi:hypothetical protein